MAIVDATPAGYGDDAAPEDAESRLEQIRALTDTALSALDLDELLEELLDRTRDILGVETAAVLLLDHGAQALVATAARGLEEEVRQGVRIPLGRGFAGTVMARREPVILQEVTPETVVNLLLVEKGIRTLLGVPMIAAGTAVGVLHVGTMQDRQFTDADVQLLQRVADRIALAAQARLARAETTAARLLARSLMPTSLPQVAGVDLAARYIPDGAGGVGGDWYDVLPLPDGRLGLVIGDVTGHGLPAAVVMGRLRSALRAYALIEDDPATVLEYLDRKLQHFEPGPMATVAYGVLSPDRHHLRISLAGHFPPALAVPGRPTTIAEAPIDPPLGTGPDITRRTTVLDVPEGAALCLFTDGLIERRDSDIGTDLERLRQAFGVGPAEQICARLLSALAGGRRTEDDIAVLTVRRCPG